MTPELLKVKTLKLQAAKPLPVTIQRNADSRTWQLYSSFLFGALVVACLTSPARLMAAPALQGQGQEQIHFFETHVRPFLVNDCYECHGAGKQKGGLRLDSRDALLKGGESGAAIVPGNGSHSLLVRALRHEHPEIHMPKGRPPLPKSVIDRFVEWIDGGAVDPRDQPPVDTQAGTSRESWEKILAARREWWSFQPLSRPAIPEVINTNWPRHDVDRFILAKLEANGLHPAAPAPPNVWLRRVHFAITGLPPTPEIAAQFGDDHSDRAKAQVIDQLLNSFHYGERWARHWMDLVRYAESYGHEQDYAIPHAWQYRDYLIRAFNADVPFDQFLREHIAGDLLTSPRRNPDQGFNESVIATGFWYLHQATHAPVDPYQDEADRIDNQVDVATKTFLGLTVACARCHDHKFDPISTRDYYGLTAFLRSSRQDISFQDYDGRIETAHAELLRQRETEGRWIQEAVRGDLKGRPIAIQSWLMASKEVLQGPARNGDWEKLERPDILIDDFEDGTYHKWTVEGQAFGEKPSMGSRGNQQAVEGFRGKRFANGYTHNDVAKGVLRSEPFRIERNYVRLLVGGGGAGGKARVVLKVGELEVRTAGGKNREKLEPVVWNVQDLMSQDVTLELVDEDDTIWGHLNVDEIVMSDFPETNPHVRPVEVVARERGISQTKLDQWVRELTSGGVRTTSHPLHTWYRGLVAATNRTPTAVSETAPSARYDAFPFPDFQTWYPSGHAFKPWKMSGPRWGFAGNHLEFIPQNAIHSGALSRGFQGTFRSPTFTIQHENIHFHTAGKAGQIRLVISRYGLRDFNSLLFERTHLDINTDDRYEWRSMTSDLKRHMGRPAYVELVDSGSGYIALDGIVMSNEAKPPEQPVEVKGTGSGLEELAGELEWRANRALSEWADEKAATNSESLVLVSWMSQKGLLEWNESRTREQLLSVAQRHSSVTTNIPAAVRVLGMTDGTAEETRVLVRGNPKTPGEIAPKGFLQVLQSTSAKNDRKAEPKMDNRLGWAEAMVNHEAALADRVIVNRVWAHLMGRGLVPTVDNFGSMGQKPTHPELLDYLAGYFRQNGRSIKGLIRMICLTHAYDMSSSPADSAAEAKDPDNALLHRQRLVRMEGEIIRDNWLAVSGRLNTNAFGPSVPTHFTPFMGNRMWVNNDNGPLDGKGRRSIYLETRRNFLSPFLVVFDLPIPDTTVGRRNSSNVPGQSLALMNDPLIQELARSWAERTLSKTNVTLEARVAELYLGGLGRKPTSQESEQLKRFVDDQAMVRKLSASEAMKDVELWTEICHVMFMMKEMIHVP